MGQKRKYVLAGNYRHFVFWCHKNGYNPNDRKSVVYVSDPQVLMGIDYQNAEFIQYETFWEHPQAVRIFQQVQIVKSITY